MILTAPNKDFDTRKTSVFLAGTIDNGNSIDWQTEVANQVVSMGNTMVFNPRRSSWNVNASTIEVLEQINWEQEYLMLCDIIFFNFAVDSNSPITLLELGQALGRNKNVVIVCPKYYYRYWNVRQTALFHNRLVHTSLEVGLDKLKQKIESIRS
jgi:hypothetical protein